uniref:Phosphoribosyl-AMP cyclohydrolase n=1 Tax=Sexangularia sp. CB-2014 TaxID=1486929 RepID=A0A7S1YAH7_9EUKA|eukprot:CAMPEP_0170733566 /NCGR_PEP_ID=MMETSP0437-20130122/2140_1 /TAXON_ID=0 /ORGANISM="Sexangularia sp." /LENGTH=1595 /DNA_ID=CAMNT_0011071851 /DNA_START=98 /DNA_END=4885 /DNA_ORIENTATION=-
MSFLLPSIDILDGNAVQLVGGDTAKERVNAGAPQAVADRYSVAGELAIVDLNAALGKGKDNSVVVRSLCSRYKCRVGGGIRTVDRALEVLSWGATKIVLGTAATPHLLAQLPRDRLIAALDCSADLKVLSHGWQSSTGDSIFDRIKELAPYVSGFLVTAVHKEGQMSGMARDLISQLLTHVDTTTHELVVAGGITTLDDCVWLARNKCRGQVGMALYTGSMSLGAALAAPLRSDRPDGLFPTVVADEAGAALGLVYSSRESVTRAVDERRGIYYSRSRDSLWIKGEESGNTQQLLTIAADCDWDALRFVVRQSGPFCHLGNRTCFGAYSEVNELSMLQRTLEARRTDAPPGSYTARLFHDHELLRAKLVEEAGELGDASDPTHVAEEAADVVYFAAVAMAKAGVSWSDVFDVLRIRSLRAGKRRPGDAKPGARKRLRDADAAKACPQANEAGTASPPPRSPVGPAALLPVRAAAEVTRAEAAPLTATAVRIASDILGDIRVRGEPAVRAHAARLGDLASADAPLVLTASEMRNIFHTLPVQQQDLLRRVSDRVRAFAARQMATIGSLDEMPLHRCGGLRGSQEVVPVASAGCYAPGGRYPLPSSVIMTCVTARVAGVGRVVAASPRPPPIVVGAAYAAGADALLTIGGVQAVGALAHGLPSLGIAACDVIVGPGNQFVTAAKAQVAQEGLARIDMLAGPSEVLVVDRLRQQTRDRLTLVAADLIAQAEHDPQARPLLIVIADEYIADQPRLDQYRTALLAALEETLARIPESAEVARISLTTAGHMTFVTTETEAASLSNVLAPEHLELLYDGAEVGLYQDYGALFVGEAAAEALGDYGVGPNHVLPTGGTARASGGLSVFNFLRVRTRLSGSSVSLEALEDVVALAQLEGLAGHANSAAQRRRLATGSVGADGTATTISPFVRPDLATGAGYSAVPPASWIARQLGVDRSTLAKLDANENALGADARVVAALASSSVEVSQYPEADVTELRQALGDLHDVPVGQVVAGAGADDVLDVVLRASAVSTVAVVEPTFSMYAHLAHMDGKAVRHLDSPALRCPDTFALHVPEVRATLTRLLQDPTIAGPLAFVICRPNNPTGDCVAADDVAALVADFPTVLFMVDEAYAEFAAAGPVAWRSVVPLLAGGARNVVVFGTFSKWAGLANARVGYALVGDAVLAAACLRLRQPYAVTSHSQRAALTALTVRDELLAGPVATLMGEMAAFVAAVGAHPRLSRWLHVYPGAAANFVLVRVASLPSFVWGIPSFALYWALRRRAVLVRYFGSGALYRCLRISAAPQPSWSQVLEVLDEAHSAATTTTTSLVDILSLALGPLPTGFARRTHVSTIILDMDGVLAEVQQSYRVAIVRTVAHFVPGDAGVVTDQDIATAKAGGNANNDWELSRRLVASRLPEGVPVPSLAEVTRAFEHTYLTDRLFEREHLLCDRGLLQRIKDAGLSLAIVTGRPRADAQRFLSQHGLADVAHVLVCHEDTLAHKPHPAPVQEALARLAAAGHGALDPFPLAKDAPVDAAKCGVALMVGDTVDDMEAAARANVFAVGVRAGPRNVDAEAGMRAAGALRVVDNVTQAVAIVLGDELQC